MRRGQGLWRKGAGNKAEGGAGDKAGGSVAGGGGGSVAGGGGGEKRVAEGGGQRGAGCGWRVAGRGNVRVAGKERSGWRGESLRVAGGGGQRGAGCGWRVAGRGNQAVDSVVEDSQASQLGSAFQSPEIYRCTSPRNNESSSIATVAVTVGSKHLSHTTGFANRVDLNGCSVDVSVSRGRGFQIDDSRSFHNPLLNHNVHDYKIAEDTNVNSVSESSDSSEICMPDFSSSSGEASHILDGTEAQSANKEDVGFSCPVGTPGQPKKGLSRFYAGKARSFSCLRDVISVKDLAKPESPYTKKRRLTSSTSRLPPLQKNCSSISKKPLQSCKSNLLLAVAMSTEDEDEKSPSGICPRQQAISAPTRCYSLSDLQGARGSLFFIGEKLIVAVTYMSLLS
ncbi:hypothetical protein KP509_10G085700 [Ceratopteris richardii]|uniref:Uncharacterized protein n=1 Tax=Ceratopteris richardii TaxID=49495 RepID=A0A8T2U321_CERRI|nr:hypothetical protein KP509_10G085700 [Ceratopteris richardii]